MSDNKKSAREILSTAVGSLDRVSTNKLYDNWAETYDNDMDAVAYPGPAKLMEQFDKLEVPKEAKILDICAGTGAIAKELIRRGYTNLHAFDGSESMLAKAKQENLYKSYSCQLFEPGSKLPYADAEFDCCLMAGIFAPGHLPIVALHEICRITKAGGVIAWINTDPAYYADKDEQYADGGFYKVCDAITAKGCWKKHEGFPVRVSPYLPYSDALVMVYDVVGKC